MSVYESFIKANHALFACYEATPNEEYQAMAKPAQQALCQDEKAAVAQFLKDDSVHFRQLIAARIASFEQQQ